MGRGQGHRRTLARAAAVVIGCSSLLAVVPLQASTPSQSTVYIDEAGGSTASWTGPTLVGNPDPLGPPAPSCTTGCDRTPITLAAPAGDTTSHVLSLTATISDTDTSTSYDVAILDSGNNVLAQTTAATGTSTTKATDVQPGNYVIEVDGDIGDAADTGYTGSVTASSAPRTLQASHGGGGITGSRETIADPFRLGTEPTIAVSPDQTVYEGPIFGFSTTQSFLQRSDNGGETFNTLGTPDLGKLTPCPGGGDEDIATDAHNNLYFLDLGGAPVVPEAVSPDHGNTFYSDCVANQVANRANTFPDRQWLSTDTINNREWFIWRDGLVNASTPTDPVAGANYGEYIEYTSLPTGGAGLSQLTYKDLCTDSTTHTLGVACITDVSIAGNAITNNNTGSTGAGNTYLAMTTGHGVGVAVITPSGVTERTAVSGASVVLFPTVAVDKAGNIYEAYTDGNTYQLMVTMSKDQGVTWTAPVAINGAPAATTVMPWIVAGNDGMVDIVFYGSPDTHAPTNNSGPWSVYMLQDLAASSTGGTAFGNWTQSLMTDRPNHIEPVCLSGLGCTTNTGPGGDRELGDFFRVALDSSGRAMVSFADGANQLGNEVTPQAAAPSFADFVRQATGPGLYGSSVPSIDLPTNSVTVGSHNDPFPFAAPTGPGPSNDALNLVGSSAYSDGTNVHVRLVIKNLNLLTADTEPGNPVAVYMTRWNFNNHVYFASAEDDAGTLSCFGGNAEPVSDGAAIKYAAYPRQTTGTCGSSSGALGTIDITIPAGAVGNPTPSDVLYSVTSYSLVQSAATAIAPPSAPDYATNLPSIVDVLPAYNVEPAESTLPEAPWTPLLLVVGVAALGFGIVRPRRRSLTPAA